ncbi:hypothetical protein THAOC_19607, partial [Thalassiosira oceanica]
MAERKLIHGGHYEEIKALGQGTWGGCKVSCPSKSRQDVKLPSRRSSPRELRRVSTSQQFARSSYFVSSSTKTLIELVDVF